MKVQYPFLMAFQFLATLSLCISWFPIKAGADVLIISDIDDTIKKTNIRASYPTVIRNTIKGRPYVALKAIYHEMKNHYQAQNEKVTFFYLTGAMEYFPTERWLIKNGFPRGLIRERGISDFLSFNDASYKIHYLKNFLRHYPHSLNTEDNVPGFRPEEGPPHQPTHHLKVFMFGDNGQADPLAYQAILADPDFDGDNLQAYIRKLYSNEEELEEILYFNHERDLIHQDPFSHILSDELKEAIGTGTIESI